MLITRRLVINNEAPETPSEGLPPSLSSAPPPTRETMEPLLAAQREGIMDKAKALASQSYYEMLDLDANASIEDARRAFFRLSKRFHPDRLPPALRGELKETAEYIFSNLKEAHSVLTDPPSREEYDRAVSSSEEQSFSSRMRDENEVRDALEAEGAFQRAVVFLKQNRLDECAEMLAQARALNPQEGEYLALETHLKILGLPTDGNFDSLLDKLRRAAGERPNSEQVNFFLASALKRAGKFNEAQTYFVRTLEINEHNIEAARELRFLKRRKADSLAGKRQSSLFKRIFK
jgi:curved DNA-binding protein CbpA